MERDLTQQKFEEVYLHYEFAPLVALGLAAGAWVKALLQRRPRALHTGAPPRHLAR